ncbi:MAG: diguanylate cyclase [Alphaproteobacteria bacterium]|nr:diguanylate cyclase [Alphaproteobacteria bacterium]
MNTPVDLTKDWLAEADLTPEQRHAWDKARAELIDARGEIQELKVRLKTLEHGSQEEGPALSVLTRPEFNREVARMLAFDERYGGISSVLYFDIENLADIQRQDGRPVADIIVRMVCDTLAKSIRNSDILGRLAADEFGVLLARCDNSAAWKKGEFIADKLHGETARVPGCTIAPVINYGAYTFNEKENVAEGLKQAAQNVTRTPPISPET